VGRGSTVGFGRGRRSVTSTGATPYTPGVDRVRIDAATIRIRARRCRARRTRFSPGDCVFETGLPTPLLLHRHRAVNFSHLAPDRPRDVVSLTRNDERLLSVHSRRTAAPGPRVWRTLSLPASFLPIAGLNLLLQRISRLSSFDGVLLPRPRPTSSRNGEPGHRQRHARHRLLMRRAASSLAKFGLRNRPTRAFTRTDVAERLREVPNNSPVVGRRLPRRASRHC